VAEILYRELSFKVVGAAMEVHRHLGPGFLEVVYHNALVQEFELQGIPFESKKPLPVVYKGKTVGMYEADIVVEEKIVLELKCVRALNAAHIAQAHHYLAATGMRLAILFNFGHESLDMKRVAK
jgi:GxxExxY protein